MQAAAIEALGAGWLHRVTQLALTFPSVAALFVERGGCYYDLPGVDPWDEDRDARLYAGPHPVVAHPPCHLWVNLAAVNWKRYQRERPAWYPGGHDQDCFYSALNSVRRWGGVLEHPAFTHAYAKYGINEPTFGMWAMAWPWSFGARMGTRDWVTEIWQSAYGHRARKRTWLFYSGDDKPPPMNWLANSGTAQIGWFDRIKPTLSKRAANATPTAFRDALLVLARASVRHVTSAPCSPTSPAPPSR